MPNKEKMNQSIHRPGGYEKPAHNIEMIKEIHGSEVKPARQAMAHGGSGGKEPKPHGRAGATLESQSKPKGDGYKEHHKQTDMVQDGAPANKAPEPMLAHSQRRHPAINPHGFGHAGSQRQGVLRMSGHPKAHRIGGGSGKRKGK